MTRENNEKQNYAHISVGKILSEPHLGAQDDTETGLPSVEAFLQNLKKDVKSEFERDEGDLFFYRGQADKDWKLIPALFRDPDYLSAEKQTIQELLSRQAQDFSADRTMFEFLVRAQHFSHPTRLLDITRSPLIALYFACADEQNIDKNGIVTIFKLKKEELTYFNETHPALLANLATLSDREKKNLIAENPEEQEKSLTALREAICHEKSGFKRGINIEALEEPIFVQPRQNNERLIAQQGAFLLFGLKNEEKNLREFFKKITVTAYEISGKKKGEILKELEILGIHESTIYPGLEHCAAYLKDSLNRLKIDADRGNSEAQFRYAERCYTGYRVKKDFEIAFKYFKKAADQGHTEAEFYLGLMYHKGEGVKKGLKQAFDYYKKTADQKSHKAQCNLGWMYYHGEGCDQNFEKALHYWELAAAEDDEQALLNLGYLYENGEKVKKDLKKTFNYYKKAADQDNAKAQSLLGAMYYQGEGCKKDLEKAFDYCKKAADQGEARAQLNLGLMYCTGEGCNQSFEKAREYWERAAAQEDEQALFNLGMMYENGDGVKKDLKKAVSYYKKAAALGSEHARKALEAHGASDSPSKQALEDLKKSDEGSEEPDKSSNAPKR